MYFSNEMMWEIKVLQVTLTSLQYYRDSLLH